MKIRFKLQFLFLMMIFLFFLYSPFILSTNCTLSYEDNFNSIRANYSWWNNSWSYRKMLLIQGTSIDLFDFPLLLTFSGTDYKCKSSPHFDDFRFIDTTNNELSFWIEEWDSDSICRVWLKIPELQAHENLTIFMYYGNPTASSKSNGFSTFLAFEDFDTTFDLNDSLSDINGWSVEFGNSTIQYNPSGRNGLGLCFQQLSSESFAHGAHFVWENQLQNLSLSYYWHVDILDIRNGYHHFFTNATQITSTRFVSGICDWWDGDIYHSFVPEATYTTNSWYLIEQIVTADEYLLKSNGISHLGELTYPNNGVDSFSWRSQSDRTYTFYIDDIYVRPYITSNPEIIYSNEEINTTPSCITTIIMGIDFLFIISVGILSFILAVYFRKKKNSI